MKTFDPSKIYRMDGLHCDYKFVGYYFEPNRPDHFKCVVIGENDLPVTFISARDKDTNFEPAQMSPMYEVVAKKYKVAFKTRRVNDCQWRISDHEYESLEDFYQMCDSSVEKSAYLLIGHD